MNTQLMFSHECIEWETPEDLFRELMGEFRFQVDACASDVNALVPVYYTAGNSCLTKEMEDSRCFMNPPYGEPERKCPSKCKKKRCVARGYHIAADIPGCIDFVRWASEQAKKGATVVCLLPARTDTAWYHQFCVPHERRFLRGRLKFTAVMQDGSIVNNSAPFPSMIVVMRPPRQSKYVWDKVA